MVQFREMLWPLAEKYWPRFREYLDTVVLDLYGDLILAHQVAKHSANQDFDLMLVPVPKRGLYLKDNIFIDSFTELWYLLRSNDYASSLPHLENALLALGTAYRISLEAKESLIAQKDYDTLNNAILKWLGIDLREYNIYPYIGLFTHD